MNENNEKYNIICLSNQQCEIRFNTNKRDVLERLAGQGHNVLFVDPPINTGRLFLRQLLRGQWGLSRMLSRTYRGKEGALVYSPLKPVPSARVTSNWHIKKINSLIEREFDTSKKTLLWVYHVQIEELERFVAEISHDVLIYDCVDNYTAFPDNSLFYSANVSKDKVVEQEKALTSNADVVFATAPGLVKHLKKYREVVHFTPNVGDYERFVNSKSYKDQLPDDMKGIKRPILGFAGAIDEYKLDRDLLRKIVSDHPNFSFVIIGPSGLKDKDATKEDLGFSDFDNIYFLGARPYESLPYYYGGFDAYIIPYVLSDYTVGGCFPVKFHDALATGMPVIVTDLPAYYPFDDVSYISKDYEEFSSNIKKAFDEDSPALAKKRQKVASENSWDGKTLQMLGHISDFIKRKP